MMMDMEYKFDTKYIRKDIFRVAMNHRIVYYKVDWEKRKLERFCEIINRDGADYDDVTKG